MITKAEDYFKYLHEIQNNNFPSHAVLLPTDETIYEVNLDKRTISIPKFLSVETDHNAEIIYFVADRYFDNMDLTNTVCLIQYVNKNAKTPEGFPADGYVYVVPFYDISYFGEKNKILFPWAIGGPATAAAGDLEFAIKFYRLTDDGSQYAFNLNTMPVTGKILHGMDIIDNGNSDNLVLPPEPNLVEDIYQRIQDVSNMSKLTWVDVF